MRTVDAHLLGDKMDEAVTHYINSHQSDEAVHVDANALALNVQEDGTRVNILHTQNFTTLCRQVPVSEHEAEGQWTEELLDPEGRLAALMAHITAQSRAPQPSHHKESVRTDVDTVILDSSMRLFNGSPLSESIVVQVPHLPPLPPLQEMKRCPDTDWFHEKTKNTLKSDESMVSEGEGGLEIAHSKQQSKKSLPHKKRISKKLKKGNGYGNVQQDIVVLSCADDVPGEEILPDSFVTGVAHSAHLADEVHHITHEVRPMLICQLCGEYYGEEQLKFYHHLKHHYEPHNAIIIDSPDLPIDKMTNSCIVDNTAALPDSIVELSLENTVPKTIYQSIDKHILYTTTDKTLNYNSNKVLYSVANMDKEPEQAVVTTEAEKTDLYETLDKLELYNCGKCNKTFRKQKQCEAHMKEAHLHAKLEEMGEFSEPEDLMEGIHVSVDEPGDQYEVPLLPHLTVDSGHVTQDHNRHWYIRNGSSAAGAGGPGPGAGACPPGGYCPVCPPAQDNSQLKVLKEEVLQRILESDVSTDAATFSENIISDAPDIPAETPPPPQKPPTPPPPPAQETKKKPPKRFDCPQCDKVFKHRNSLLYHMLSHSGKQHSCRECGKGFYTASSLKVHKRVHNGDKPYKCDTCGRDFRQWSDLTYHKISKHSDVKMFKCDFCGKEFARKYSLNVHRRIHTGERNYKCEYCSKSFSASCYRNSHMRTHTGDRPYKCNECEKCFRVAGDLRRHTLIHEKVRNRLEADKKKPKTDKDSPPAKTETKTKNPPQKIVKKIAVASTTKSPQFKNQKSTKKKNMDGKKGAPNVTLEELDSSYTNNVDVFDAKQNYEYTLLRPIFRTNEQCENKAVAKVENTDGKMHIYTHIEDGKEFITMVNGAGSAMGELRDELRGEIRDELRDKLRDEPGEGAESGFIERLTALYNIPAV